MHPNGIRLLPGQRFGRLTVLSEAPERAPDRKIKWLCQCDCGARKVVRGRSLRLGKTMSCGCLHRDLVSPGDRFGHLVVIRQDTVPSGNTNRNYRWVCQCDCGKQVSPRGSNLNLGKAMSCGCRTIKHGMHSTPEYLAWVQLRVRCTNPSNPNYHHYGGRGITVCPEWADFAVFYRDMGSRPTPKHSIDRINNDGNYEPGNCRWATAIQQANNRRQRKDHAAGA